MRLLRYIFPALLLIMLMVGCGPSRQQIEAEEAVRLYYRGDFDRAIEKLTPLAEETNEDFVLNNMRLGATALAAGELDTAERAYYAAYEALNSAGVNNTARTAATVFLNERFKVWLGEPYERALANFHLGIVYYLRGDYANARGAFENSLFKLRRYADEEDEKSNFDETESSFAIAHYMLGRCWLNLGRRDMAADSFKRARDLDATLREIASIEAAEQSNALLIVDAGRAPKKIESGAGVTFASPTMYYTPPRPRVGLVAGSVGPIVEAADLGQMARQRRWQTTDTFRAIKKVTGTGLMYGGIIVADQGMHRGKDEAVAAGVGMVLLGALLDASSRPDLRQWEMAPAAIYVVPLTLQPGTHDLDVGVANGRVRFENFPVPESGEASLYARLLPSAQTTLDFAPPAPLPAAAQP